ncbi:MAG: hypothetical protein M3R66_09745, partial [Actinomycetota bacterium]|nr:hypothetical protein [Actinomycetota bacterium]
MGSTSLWRSWGTIAIVAVVAVGCAGSGDDAGSTDSQPSTAASEESGPLGVVALGHSGLTGENSDPDRPGEDVPENSWATGTAPEVDSTYQRLVALRPETRDRVANQAQGGADADAEHVEEFGAAVDATLDVITAASPDSRILLVGQMG